MKRPKKPPLPDEFRTLEEAGEFWDTHSAVDYWDEMEDVNAKVDIESRRFVITLDDAVYRAAKKRAKAEHLSPNEFINRLLQKELGAQSE